LKIDWLFELMRLALSHFQPYLQSFFHQLDQHCQKDLVMLPHCLKAAPKYFQKHRWVLFMLAFHFESFRLQLLYFMVVFEVVQLWVQF
jgi:hypothetical protein